MTSSKHPIHSSFSAGGDGIGTDAAFGEQSMEKGGCILSDGMVQGEEDDGRETCGVYKIKYRLKMIIVQILIIIIAF
jgi:hypothetical protein